MIAIAADVWSVLLEQVCSLTFLGHKESIITLEFHKNCPSFLSASFDKAIITSTNFHQSKDLIPSVSMNTIVCICDLSPFSRKIAPVLKLSMSCRVIIFLCIGHVFIPYKI
ncbi:WD domain, G-beta repeat protein [Medicago truncatula]|uniref:WD domain, G-beta repeat protein n=1 Tax=Medicago truncatula TaxID=3880 RepID=G7IU68_MEDTR|nr:WD domain, G-beta repeat protein [Medicago truncatula]